MEGLERHLICSPHLRAHHLSRCARSALQTTLVVGPRIPSTVTATPQSRSPLPEVQLVTKVKDSAPCLFLQLSSAICPTPPRRVTPVFACIHRPTACTVIHSPPHHALLLALIKWPPLPLPVTRVHFLARLPVGL